nr:sugar ABC transporter permease [Rubritepida sp.]
MSEAVLAGAPPRRRRLGEALGAWLLTLPAALSFLLLLLLPTLAAVAMAFTDFELGVWPPLWIGFENFTEMWEDRGFRQSFRNTVVYVGLVAPASVLLGLGLALLIEAGARGRAFFRAVFFLPVVSLTVAMAAAWQYLLHPTIGP